MHVAAGLRQRGVRQAAALRRLRRASTRSSSRTCTPTTSSTSSRSPTRSSYAPRQQPVAVGGWPGTDDPARPCCTCPTAARDVFRAWSARGAARTWSRPRSSCASTTRPRARGRRRCAVRFQEVPHFTRTHAVEFAADGAGRLTYGADHAPTDALVDFAARHRPAADRGDAAAARARGPARAPDARARPASTGAARGRAGWCSRTSPTSSTPTGRAPRPSAEFGGPVELASEGAAYIV